MANLSMLPPEITCDLLHYLPIHSLLNFGLTSKQNHSLSIASLSSLRLGVFHSRLGGMVSLMEATADRSCLHSVQMILSKRDSRTKDKVISNQNQAVRTVVDRYQSSLRDVEVALWEMQESAAKSIAELQNLKRLSVRLDHPHTRYSGVDAQFWETSPGSSVWNFLAPKTGKANALGRLQSLSLERAGLTDFQLARILDTNPLLTELRLRKCFNLTEKTFKTLADSKVGQQLETLHFTKSQSEGIDDRILDCIGMFPKLKSLSLNGCPNIDVDLVKRLNEQKWHIPDLTLPSAPNMTSQGVEIDDEYK